MVFEDSQADPGSRHLARTESDLEHNAAIEGNLGGKEGRTWSACSRGFCGVGVDPGWSAAGSCSQSSELRLGEVGGPTASLSFGSVLSSS
jgi:hypothetical protein